MEFSHTFADADGGYVLDEYRMLGVSNAPAGFCTEDGGNMAFHPSQPTAPGAQLTLVADNQQKEGS